MAESTTGAGQHCPTCICGRAPVSPVPQGTEVEGGSFADAVAYLRRFPPTEGQRAGIEAAIVWLEIADQWVPVDAEGSED